jgi:hypothetical protein
MSVENATQEEVAEASSPAEAPFVPVRVVNCEGLSLIAQQIAVLAGPKGIKGASYEYIVVPGREIASIFSPEDPSASGLVYDFLADVKFHEGLDESQPANGICETALLAIVADRLSSFQGPMGTSWDIDQALTCVVNAINWINRATLSRHREAQMQEAMEAQQAMQGSVEP